MFDVKQNFFLFPVVPNESMQCVRMINPAKQTWVCWQWDNCVSLNSENSNQDNQYITALKLFRHITKGRSWMRCSSITLALTQTQKCKYETDQRAILRIYRLFCLPPAYTELSDETEYNKRYSYPRCLLEVSWSPANSVFTKPNSCMTRSSWRKSSWPFSTNINSEPLLPARSVQQLPLTGLSLREGCPLWVEREH